MLSMSFIACKHRKRSMLATPKRRDSLNVFADARGWTPRILLSPLLSANGLHLTRRRFRPFPRESKLGINEPDDR